MKRLARLLAVPLLLAALPASAMDEASWDFRGQVPARVEANHLSVVESTDQGLFIQTATDGFLQLPPPASRTDSLTITLTNVATPTIALLWRTPDLGTGEFYQSNVDLPVGQSKEATFTLNQIADWDGDVDMVGLAFPAGSEVLVETMAWKSYSPVEKAWNGFLSFWTPDRFTLYSINFLWGPLIGTTPESRAALFATLPPHAWSATRIFYGAFVLAAAVVLALAWNKPDRRARFLAGIAIAGAALWILFDARMTMEIARYVADDWRTYVLAAPEDRVLRTHSNLYDVLSDVDKLLGDDGTYALLPADGTPFFANVRYRLYPAVPVEAVPGADTDAWIVLGRPDVSVNDGALTLADGTVLSPKGAVVQRFDDSSFFFRRTP